MVTTVCDTSSSAWPTMVTTDAPCRSQHTDDLILVSAAATVPPAATTMERGSSSSSSSGGSSTSCSSSSGRSNCGRHPRLSHSVSTDSFLQLEEADTCMDHQHSNSLGIHSMGGTINSINRQEELPPLPAPLNMSAPFACVAAMASHLSGSNNNHNTSNKGLPQHMVEWEQASRQVTTWGTNAVLQQHQQHAILGSSNSTGHLGDANVPCNPPSGAGGAGAKRPRPSRGNRSRSSSTTTMSHRPCPTTDDMSPQDFLWQILEERGYETSPLLAKSQAFFRPPTPKQVDDYDMPLVNAVKAGDLEGLKGMAAIGRQMDACNRYGESIVHISCRRGQAETLRFLLANGGRVHMCDDLGRTPLHDACWAKEPVFDCISTILDADPCLIRVVDCRGASPLAYIRREHWREWREFFDSKKEKYWAPLPGSALLLQAAVAASASGMENGEEEEEGALTMDASSSSNSSVSSQGEAGGASPMRLHSASSAGPVTATASWEDEEEEEGDLTPTRRSRRQRRRQWSHGKEGETSRGFHVDAAVSALSL